jgi:hypothetical protein
MTAGQIIFKHLENIRTGMIEEQRIKRIIASGKSAASLVSKVSEDEKGVRGTLIGEDYWEDQEKGGGPQPDLEVSETRQWMRDKGIETSAPENEQERIAFLITRKLRRDGWNPEGERVGITQIVNKEINPMLVSLGNASELEITSQILDAYKR